MKLDEAIEVLNKRNEALSVLMVHGFGALNSQALALDRIATALERLVRLAQDTR